MNWFFFFCLKVYGEVLEGPSSVRGLGLLRRIQQNRHGGMGLVVHLCFLFQALIYLSVTPGAFGGGPANPHDPERQGVGAQVLLLRRHRPHSGSQLRHVSRGGFFREDGEDLTSLFISSHFLPPSLDSLRSLLKRGCQKSLPTSTSSSSESLDVFPRDAAKPLLARLPPSPPSPSSPPPSRQNNLSG